MGAIVDLPSPEWFGDFPTSVTVHVIDSSRPQNLSSVFGGGENGDRIVIWDDGGVEDLEEERKAWETLTVSSSPAMSVRGSSIAIPSMRLKRTRMMTLTLTLTRRQKKTRMRRKRTMRMARAQRHHHENASH